MLGRLLQLQGEYATAEELHRRVLEIRRQELPENSLELAQALDRLGSALLYQARLEEAEDLGQRALELQPRIPDPRAAALRRCR